MNVSHYAVQVVNIEWDTDCGRVRGLPKKLSFNLEVEPTEEGEADLDQQIADYPTVEFGWCVENFEVRALKPLDVDDAA